MTTALTGIMILFLVFGADAISAKPLKEICSGDFQTSAALAERYVFEPYVQNEKALRLLRQEFNCVTSENLMKSASLRTGRGEFRFDRAANVSRVPRQRGHATGPLPLY